MTRLHSLATLLREFPWLKAEPCPGPEEIAAFADCAPMPAADRRRLILHLAECDGCREVLECVLDFQVAEAEAAESVSAPSELWPTPGLQDLERAVQSLEPGSTIYLKREPSEYGVGVFGPAIERVKRGAK